MLQLCERCGVHLNSLSLSRLVACLQSTSWLISESFCSIELRHLSKRSRKRRSSGLGTVQGQPQLNVVAIVRICKVGSLQSSHCRTIR